jgi:hypothetical protein
MREVLVGVRGTLAEWLGLQWQELTFHGAESALLVFVALLAASLLVLLVRGFVARRPGRGHIALPAVLPVMRSSVLAGTRHAPIVLFLAGLPFFAVALADPRTSFTRDEVSYPGRRIALVLDGSSSMTTKFEAKSFGVVEGRAFYTSVAAAERFVRMRMAGPYRDLIAVIEFGNQAFVITPFTTDYESVLTSLKLVGDPRNWGRLEDAGTTILRGVDQAENLFRAFDFLEAAGNTTILFTDGRDDAIELDGRKMADVMGSARKQLIPVHMVRIAAGMEIGKVKEDKIWQAAMESTGGRFYPVHDEQSLVRALRDIDRLSAGQIDRREYTVQRPRFAGYALIAVLAWLSAAALKLSVRSFSTFP